MGLFIALNYWNDWYAAMLYIDDDRMYPLQYYLNDILNKSQGMMNAAARAGIPTSQVPSEPVKACDDCGGYRSYCPAVSIFTKVFR